MNKFSLINVAERKDGLVSGVWLQDAQVLRMKPLNVQETQKKQMETELK